MAIPWLSVIVGSALILLVVYQSLLYPYFLSPLSKIPNAHFLSPVSRFWIVWVRLNERNNQTLLAAHRRHGPIVRVAPNEVSINCVDDGTRNIYAGGMEKPRWYPDQFASYG